eukprot:10714561-Lingulodinium_polyedra.AAC.1
MLFAGLTNGSNLLHEYLCQWLAQHLSFQGPQLPATPDSRCLAGQFWGSCLTFWMRWPQSG